MCTHWKYTSLSIVRQGITVKIRASWTFELMQNWVAVPLAFSFSILILLVQCIQKNNNALKGCIWQGCNSGPPPPVLINHMVIIILIPEYFLNDSDCIFNYVLVPVSSRENGPRWWWSSCLFQYILLWHMKYSWGLHFMYKHLFKRMKLLKIGLSCLVFKFNRKVNHRVL